MLAEIVAIVLYSNSKYQHSSALPFSLSLSPPAAVPHPAAQVSRPRAARSDFGEPQTTHRSQEEVCAGESARNRIVRLARFPHTARIISRS